MNTAILYCFGYTPASSDQGDTWKEIVKAKDRDCSIEPTIFTSQFFKQGIRTLTNEITAYFSKFATEEAVQKSIKDEITLICEMVRQNLTFSSASQFRKI